jgi:hypothetical protein
MGASRSWLNPPIGRGVAPELADKPGALLRRLILAGRDTLADDRAAAEKTRLRAVEATSGALAGVFGPEYLSDLREDWPE